MGINLIEMVDVLAAAALIFIAIQKKDVATWLFILFVYGTLHFSFGAVALTNNESAKLLIALHEQGGGMLAELSAFIVLAVVFVLLSRASYMSPFLQRECDERWVAFHILLVMGGVFCGYVFNIRPDDWLQLKNVVSVEVMFALILLGFIGLMNAPILTAAKIRSWGLGALFVLVATDCIAFYEVFGHYTWAATMESSGAMVYRASSILFNPNLLGFWASLVYLACAYGMHEYKEHRRMMLWGMVLTSIAIYLSGSRSAGYLLLGVSFFAAILTKGNFKWFPSLVVLPLTMLAMYVGTMWLAIPLSQDNEGWREIALLGERFAATPLNVIRYTLTFVDISFPIYMGAPPEIMGAPPEIVESIEGRFLGEGRDAGWFALYYDVGWLGVVAMLWASLMSLQLAMRSYFSRRDAASVYALVILCYCLLIGLVMRFQIFPIWLFIGVIISPCLALWKKATTLNPSLQVANAHIDS